MDRLHWTPVGPLPAAVYWRRRAGVLLGALVVVLLLLRLGGSDDGTLSQPAPTARPSSPTSATPSAAPGPSGDVAACAPPDLRVQADTAPADVPSGSGAAVRVAVTNTSDTPCSVRLGGAAVELLVLSGSDRIWSSADCAEEREDGRVDLAPGERRLLEQAWDGRRSRPGCPGGGEVARPGTYRVLARVGAVEVEGRAFRVT